MKERIVQWFRRPQVEEEDSPDYCDWCHYPNPPFRPDPPKDRPFFKQRFEQDRDYYAWAIIALCVVTNVFVQCAHRKDALLVHVRYIGPSGRNMTATVGLWLSCGNREVCSPLGARPDKWGQYNGQLSTVKISLVIVPVFSLIIIGFNLRFLCYIYNNQRYAALLSLCTIPHCFAAILVCFLMTKTFNAIAAEQFHPDNAQLGHAAVWPRAGFLASALILVLNGMIALPS